MNGIVRRNKQHEDIKYKIHGIYNRGKFYPYPDQHFLKNKRNVLCAKSDLQDLKNFIFYSRSFSKNIWRIIMQFSKLSF